MRISDLLCASVMVYGVICIFTTIDMLLNERVSTCHFTAVTSTVKSTLNEALVQILSPRRRIDILRDVMEVKQQRRPYVVTFCGVNGVGKSTNLAKVTQSTSALTVLYHSNTLIRLLFQGDLFVF